MDTYRGNMDSSSGKYEELFQKVGKVLDKKIDQARIAKKQVSHRRYVIVFIIIIVIVCTYVSIIYIKPDTEVEYAGVATLISFLWLIPSSLFYIYNQRKIQHIRKMITPPTVVKTNIKSLTLDQQAEIVVETNTQLSEDPIISKEQTIHVLTKAMAKRLPFRDASQLAEKTYKNIAKQATDNSAKHETSNITEEEDTNTVTASKEELTPADVRPKNVAVSLFHAIEAYRKTEIQEKSYTHSDVGKKVQ